MNTTQIEARATATSLWDTCSELEGTHVQFYQIRNLLYVYDEHMENEIDFLQKSNDGYVKLFISRYDRLRSMIEIMLLHFNEAIEAMRTQIDDAYEAERRISQRPITK